MSEYTKENVRVVILAGAKDFGRCPLATRVRRCLWPVIDRPAAGLIIEKLYAQGIRKISVCCEGDGDEVKSVLDVPSGCDLKIIEQELPRGTAGSILDGYEDGDEYVLALEGGSIFNGDVDSFFAGHIKGGADMTIFFDTPEGKAIRGNHARAYVCSRSAIECIPAEGYCDLKETLIAELVKRSFSVRSERIKSEVLNYHSWNQYLAAVCNYLEDMKGDSEDFFGNYKQYDGGDVFVGNDVEIGEDVRLFGPIIICEGAKIHKGSIILGPTVIGGGSVISSNSIVEGSVLWEGSVVGNGSAVQRSLIDSGSFAAPFKKIYGKLVSGIKGSLGAVSRVEKAIVTESEKVTGFVRPAGSGPILSSGGGKRGYLGALAGFVAIMIAAFWAYFDPTLKDLWGIWTGSDEFSGGILVPFLAGHVLLVKKEDWFGIRVKPALIIGSFCLLVFQLMRLAGLYGYYSSLERLSFVGVTGCACLLTFGWRFLLKLWPIFLFLLLMLPLPNRYQLAITGPLQDWATSSAVFCLEMFGYTIVRKGNLIEIGQTTVAVAEACNGLRMLTAFVIIAAWIALISRRKWWEKVLIVLSSVPIALICNTIRLTVTAIAFTVLSGEKWEKIFHDWGGLAMMPLALVMIVAELWLLSNIFLEDTYKSEKTEEGVVMSKYRKGNDE